MSDRHLLIVNADDYGLTAGVSRGILDGHRRGIVTSTSVLAVAPAFAEWAPRLRDTEDIGVGAHLALVGEDPPLLSRAELPTLVDRQGRLPRSWRQLLPRLAAGRIDLREVRLELHAQLERMRASGLALTHVDSHQHVHLWPSLATVVLDVAEEAGIDAARIIRSSRRSPVGRAVRTLGIRFERRARERGVRFPVDATGLDEAGTLTLPRLLAAVERLATAAGSGAVELAVHPGEADDPDRARYRWGYRWGDELDALTQPAAREAVAAAGLRLGTYADILLR